MTPSAASVWTNSSIRSATWVGVPMNDWRPVTSMIRSRIERSLASARWRQSAAVFSGSGYIRARPWMIDVADTSGSTSGSGPSAS